MQNSASVRIRCRSELDDLSSTNLCQLWISAINVFPILKLSTPRSISNTPERQRNIAWGMPSFHFLLSALQMLSALMLLPIAVYHLVLLSLQYLMSPTHIYLFKWHLSLSYQMDWREKLITTNLLITENEFCYSTCYLF